MERTSGVKAKRAALLAEARTKRQRWQDAGAPGRLHLLEAEGINICDALYDTGLAGMRQRLQALCAAVAVLCAFNAWKVFWYRLAGVRIGQGVSIAYGAKIDPVAPWLVTLEDGCVLGVETLVAAHLFYRDKLVLRRIRIGKRAVAGVRSVVFASLGDNAVLGPNSTLFADAQAHATLLGTPARPV